MEPRSTKGLFVGYDDCMSKTYHVYNPRTCWIVISKDVMFNEEIMREVALKEKKVRKLDFFATIPIVLEDANDKPLANEKFEDKEVATPMANHGNLDIGNFMNNGVDMEHILLPTKIVLASSPKKQHTQITSSKQLHSAPSYSKE